MEKNSLAKRPSHGVLKIMLLMKLAILIIFTTALQVAAKDSISQETVTVDFNNTKLTKALKEVESKTHYRFVFSNMILKENVKVTIAAKNIMVKELLAKMLAGTGLVYEDLDNNLVVIKIMENQAIAFPLKGKIINSKGEPMAGVSVTVKGAATGTNTDADGNFSLQVPDKEATLVFSYVGFVTQEVAVAGQTEINVTLVQQVAELSDVIVVGYGVQKKRDLTGSISQIKGSELTQLPVQRVDQALQGRAAGVLVLNNDGAPGGNTTIRIRGMNSINGGNNALIVIDGLQGGNLNSLNPNDIESIEVLKDASATAIYGSQGANGVILITTKNGKKGKPVIDYSYNIGTQSIRHKLEVMGAADYARTVNAYRETQNLAGPPVLVFTDAQIQQFEKTGGTDWQDEIYRKGTLQNHQLSIGGGTDNIKYMISGGYLDQQGILINSAYKRFSLRANLTTVISKNVNFGINWAGAKETGSLPPFGSEAVSFLGQGVNGAPRWDPTTPVYDADGNYTVHPAGYGAYDVWNPVAATKEPSIENNTIRNTVNAFLEFKIIEGLTLRVTGGAVIRNVNNKSYFNSKTFEGKPTQGRVGYGTEAENVSTRYQNSNILTYTKQIGKLHNITVMGVAEQQYEKFKGSSLVAKKFTVDQTGIFDLGGASEVVNSSVADERVIHSYLGRVNYAFADKYLLTASFRADGSSVFGKNNKWGYFPAASVAWRMSEESFIDNLNLFSELKLRGSWGVTGNQAINPYQTLAKIASGGNYPYNGNETTDLGFYILSAANPSLKWESTTQTDIGIDMGFFRGRLQLTADYYKKTTKDLLLSRELPGYTGLSTIIDNVGSVENKGFELAISGDPLVGKVRWNSGFNISVNRNKVLDLGETDKIAYRTTLGGYSVNNAFMFLVKGEPFGQIYGYGYEGTWNQKDASAAAAFGQLPGDPKYTDLNKDGTIDTKDLKVIGNAFPDFIYGWTNRVSYKNFELTLLIQGTQGNDVFNQARIRLENPAEAVSTKILDRWTPDNQNTNVPAFIDQVTRQDAGLTSKIRISGDQRLSRWVEDASYLRLKNITLAYDLPTGLIKKIGFTKLRAYVTGANLITLTKYTGYDPEVSSFNASDARIGVDFSTYPSFKSYSIGINLSF